MKKIKKMKHMYLIHEFFRNIYIRNRIAFNEPTTLIVKFDEISLYNDENTLFEYKLKNRKVVKK